VIFYSSLIAINGCEPTPGVEGVISADLNEIQIEPGSWSPDIYLPLLKDKKVACVFNQSSLFKDRHMVDFLLENKIEITKVFTLEHGFRGDADAGAIIKDDKDLKTGLPLVSLYGKNKKPSPDDLDDVDVVLFDIQDVGVRFYTYISTLHYIMEACAEHAVPLIVLDRPNPNAHFIDGPILEKEFTSFIGMHPVPVVYGMTIGEYGNMINGEGWLNDKVKCNLTVVPCKNYNHAMLYQLPVKPSPNLPNIRSILLYPSLCFFEGTSVSIGRGTTKQFQIYGHPGMSRELFNFIPKPHKGAKSPKHNGIDCYGYDLSTVNVEELHFKEQLDISILLKTHDQLIFLGEEFFTRPKFFDKLSGNNKFRTQIEKGLTEAEIRDSWFSDLNRFRIKRKQYLIYK
jgi:uncharacterized protein YbbC (DUF1343 family)